MAHEKILVVEDDRDILELMTYNLEKEGYVVATAMAGEEALKKISQFDPDLILLDLMLPGIDGMEICRQLKQQEKTRGIPIIFVTAKSEETDVVTGLEIGAEDYLAKPFSPKVLIARIRSVLRRVKKKTGEAPVNIITLKGLSIDVSRHLVTSSGEVIDLYATEFAILHFLAQNPGWVFSRNQIISSVKGDDYPVTERSVDVQILGLRKKLGEAGKMIQTVRGVGYRLNI